MLGDRRSPSAPSTVCVYVWGRLPHPFIITLATLSVARGLALWLSGGQPQPGHARRRPAHRRRARSAGSRTRRSSWPALALLALLLTTRLVWGRWIYAVGGNPDGARRAAIPVNGS